MTTVSASIARLDIDTDLFPFISYQAAFHVDLDKLPTTVRNNVLLALHRGYIGSYGSVGAKIYKLVCASTGVYPVMRGRFDAQFPVAHEHAQQLHEEFVATLRLLTVPTRLEGYYGAGIEYLIGRIHTIPIDQQYSAVYMRRPEWVKWNVFWNLYEKYGLVNDEQNVARAIELVNNGDTIVVRLNQGA